MSRNTPSTSHMSSNADISTFGSIERSDLPAIQPERTAATVRILHLASGDLWAGAEVQLYQLLRKLRHHPNITASAVILNEGELARRLSMEGIATLVLDERKLSTPAIFGKLLNHMRAIRPDVVHTHRVKENILGSTCALLLPGTRSVRTVHGEEEGDVQSTLRQSILHGANHFAARWLQQRTVAVSGSLAQSFEARLGKARVIMIKNGVDPAYVQEQARGLQLRLESESSHLAFVGRMVPVKRVDRFLQLARLLINRHGPKAFRFHLIGDGPLYSEMQELARSLNIDSQCIFHGFARNPLPWLNQMSALVLTSDYEGTPMVILEALALGIPVVAPAVGGLTEMLAIDGGYLVADQRMEEYATAVEKAIARARSEPRKAFTVPEDYDIATGVRRYVELYKSLVGRKPEAI
jgi:glycosyltransferase involved in cell wall biosynthesis